MPYPLPQHAQKRILATGLAAEITGHLGDLGGQARLSISLTRRQHSGIAGYMATAEIGFNPPPFSPWK